MRRQPDCEHDCRGGDGTRAGIGGVFAAIESGDRRAEHAPERDRQLGGEQR